MEIDAKTVMALRNKTGLSMMECKRALQEASGNMEAAEDLLRKKLKGKMDARTERAAGEGRIAVATNPEPALRPLSNSAPRPISRPRTRSSSRSPASSPNSPLMRTRATLFRLPP